MSDEQKIATVTAEAEAAPALPTSEPPVEDPKPEVGKEKLKGPLKDCWGPYL